MQIENTLVATGTPENLAALRDALSSHDTVLDLERVMPPPAGLSVAGKRAWIREHWGIVHGSVAGAELAANDPDKGVLIYHFNSQASAPVAFFATLATNHPDVQLTLLIRHNAAEGSYKYRWYDGRQQDAGAFDITTAVAAGLQALPAQPGPAAARDQPTGGEPWAVLDLHLPTALRVSSTPERLGAHLTEEAQQATQRAFAIDKLIATGWSVERPVAPLRFDGQLDIEVRFRKRFKTARQAEAEIATIGLRNAETWSFGWDEQPDGDVAYMTIPDE
jgi:hypothetical protein